MATNPNPAAHEPDPETEPPAEESKTAKRFLEIFSQAKSFITYFFSTVPLALISPLPFQGEVILIVLLSLVLWVMINEFVLFVFEEGWTHKNHTRWFLTMEMLSIFITQLGLYLFFQLIFGNINVLFQQGVIDVGETVVLIIIIIIFVYAVFGIFYDIYNYDNKKK